MHTDDLKAWEQWMRAAGYTDKTVHTRVSQIKIMCRAVGLNDPRTVSTRQVVDWLSRCDAPWTRYTYAASVRAWCKWLVEQELREDNPTTRVPKPKQPQSSPRPVPWRVIEAVLADPPGIRALAYLTLMAYAGLRCAEVAAVRGEDLDHDRGWLYVTGKGGQRLAVPLHPAIRRMSIGFPDEGPWFPGLDHGHVRPKAVSKTVRNALRLAGSSASAHGVRHAFATRLLHQCHDTRVVQLLMRHRSLASTQVYVGVDSAALVSAIHSLGDVA